MALQEEHQSSRAVALHQGQVTKPLQAVKYTRADYLSFAPRRETMHLRTVCNLNRIYYNMAQSRRAVVPISEQRRTLVETAKQQWISRLIDLSRRNNLLYYRPLKTGNLELSEVESNRMVALLSGEKVPISKLLDHSTDERLTSKLREIWRRAQSNAEEKGLGTLFITIGMATWKALDGGRDPEAPALLLPVTLELKGTLGQAFSIRRTGAVQVNLVLLHVLESELGIRLSGEDILPLLQGDDEGEAFDPSPVYKYLTEKSRNVPGFQVKSSAVLGNFAFQKMAMVNDLRERGEDLVANDIIAALPATLKRASRSAHKTSNPIHENSTSARRRMSF